MVYTQRLCVEWGRRDETSPLGDCWQNFGGLLACALLSNEPATQSRPSHILFPSHSGSSDQHLHSSCQFLLPYSAQVRTWIDHAVSDMLGVYGLPAAQQSRRSSIMLCQLQFGTDSAVFHYAHIDKHVITSYLPIITVIMGLFPIVTVTMDTWFQQ